MTTIKKQSGIHKVLFNSPLRLAIYFVITILLVDLGLELIKIFLPPTDRLTAALTDGIFLLILLAPALYVFILRPMLRYVSERKQAEEELIAAKDLSESLMQAANVIVIGLNEAGKINLFNETAEKITGYTFKELKGKNWFETLVPKEKYSHVWEEFSSLTQRGRVPKTFENPILTKTGEERYISWQNGVLHEGEKKIGSISFGIDITERKQAEDELKTSEKKYNDLFEKSKDGNLIIIDGKFVECNQSILKMLHYNHKNELLNIHPSEISPEFQPDGKASYEKANEMMNIAMEKGSHRFEWMHKKADGEVFPAEVLLTVVNSEKKMIHTVLREITERKQIEEEMLKFRRGIENSTDAIFMSDSQGVITYANAAFEKVYGFPQEETIGRTPRILKSGLLPPDAYENLWATLLNKEIVAGEIINKTKDGRFITIDASNNPTLDIDGKIVGFLSIHRDITERKQLELERQVLSEITHGVTTTANLDELLLLIHQSLKKVLYAENCFFALYDPNTKLFSFPYFVDQYDQAPVPLALEKSCTAYIFRAGKSLLIDKHLFEQLKEQNEVELVGSNSPSWIGVPLRTSDRIIGVLVLQHYEKENIFNEDHLRFLDSIGSQVANVIERKRAEEELEKSFSLLTATLESTADGILVVDKNGKIADFNKRFVELWRIPETIISTRDDEKLISFILEQLKDPAGFSKKVNELYLNGEEISFDVIEFKDGRTFERYSQSQRFEGKSVGRVWSFHDITNLMHAEKELRESEEKFRTFFEKSPIGIEIYDATGAQIDANPAALDMFGIDDKNNVVGFNIFEGTSLSNEVKEKLYNGIPVEYTALYDFDKISEINQYKTNRTGKADMEYSITPLKTVEAENILGYLLLVQYITQRKRAEEALKESEATLHELNATKDKFFSIIAHDLKSPFNSIAGFSGHLVEQVREKNYAGIEEYAGIIQTSSKHAMNLLSNLLEWSLSQTGRIVYNPEYIEMVELITEVTELSTDAARQKSITLSKELPLNVFVFADKNMISTIFRNLISNAIKFTNPGGKIVVSVEKKKDELLAAVRDSGIGIKQPSIEKLFRIDESYSTSGTQNEKGTGLGLILCKEFVEKHGGKIWAESEPGKGSVFYFTIPVH